MRAKGCRHRQRTGRRALASWPTQSTTTNARRTSDQPQRQARPAELVRLFDPAMLNRPADLEAVLKQLTVLEPANLTAVPPLTGARED